MNPEEVSSIIDLTISMYIINKLYTVFNAVKRAN